MTDLLDDLRHANPVDPDTLEVAPYPVRTRPPRPARHAWRLVAAAVLIVTVVALLPGRTTKHNESLAARAYAAVTKPGVVHWRTALRTHVGTEGNTQTLTEGWSHNGVTHVLMWERSNRKPRLVLDLRTAGGRTTTWTDGADTLSHSRARPTGSDPNSFAADPMAIFRRAFQSGKLSQLRPGRLKVDLPGRSDDQGDFTAYYDIDPKTSLPLRYVTVSPSGATSTVQFRVYETLPLDATTRTKLRLLKHPAPASATTTAAEHFAVLRKGTPPSGKLGQAVKLIARARDVDAAAARALTAGIAIAPTKDGVCLITVSKRGAGSGCAGLSRVLRRGIGMGVPNPAPVPGPAQMKAGVDLAVPDGVVAVRTRFHGRWTRRAVHGNVLHIPRFSGQYVLVRR